MLRHVVGYGFDRLGRIGHRARQTNAFERRQVVQVITDERHFVQGQVLAYAQVLDDTAFVRDPTEHVVDL
jgi:hypothetical protein